MNTKEQKEGDQVAKIKAFEEAARPLIQYLAENHHPHVTAIVTSTSAELLEAKMSTGQIMDYIQD